MTALMVSLHKPPFMVCTGLMHCILRTSLEASHACNGLPWMNNSTWGYAQECGKYGGIAMKWIASAKTEDTKDWDGKKKTT